MDKVCVDVDLYHPCDSSKFSTCQLDQIQIPGLSKQEMQKAKQIERERRRRKKAKKKEKERAAKEGNSASTDDNLDEE